MGGEGNTEGSYLKNCSPPPPWRVFINPYAAVAKSLQSWPILCDPRDSSPPGSPIPGILQARTLEWVAISFSNAWKWKWSPQSRLTPSDSMDLSLPGSSIHGIFQARVLEWGAIVFSNISPYRGLYKMRAHGFESVMRNTEGLGSYLLPLELF